METPSDDSNAGQAHDATPGLPARTTPTWEIELLLSGAVVFALFQLPGPVHAWGASAIARLGNSGEMLVRLGMVYALIVVYALIAMFLVHLTARAYWVALVGVHSVYPAGIRWERYRNGPVAHFEMRRRIPSIPVLIERADNFASLCFAFGLLVVISALLGSAFALPMTALAILVSEYLFDGQHLNVLFYAFTAVLLAPAIGLGLADRWLARRHGLDHEPQGLLARCIARFTGSRLNTLPAPLMLMLATNQRGRRAYVLFFLAMLLLMLALVADEALRSGRFNVASYSYLPTGAVSGDIDPRHYRAFRGDATAPSHLPTIDTLVVEGDWLQMVLPFDPQRHGMLLERRCTTGHAEARALAAAIALPASDPARQPAEQRVLDCLAGELDLRLDGAALADAPLVFGSDPDTGLRGVVAMVPVAALARGRHALSLQLPPPTRAWSDTERMDRHQQQGRTQILFWK